MNIFSECNLASPSHTKLPLPLSESSLEPLRNIPEQVDYNSSNVSAEKVPENILDTPQTEESIPSVPPVTSPDFTEQPPRKRIATNPENARPLTSPSKIVIRPRPRLPQEDNAASVFRSSSTSPVKRSTQFRPISAYTSDENAYSYSTSNSTSPTKPLTASSHSNRSSGSFDNQLPTRRRSNSKISDKIAFFDTASQGDTKSLPRFVKKSLHQCTSPEATAPVKESITTSGSQMKLSRSFNNFSTAVSMEESDKRKSGLLSPPSVTSPILETPQTTAL